MLLRRSKMSKEKYGESRITSELHHRENGVQGEGGYLYG